MKKYCVILSEEEKKIVQNFYLRSKKQCTAIDYKKLILDKFIGFGCLDQYSNYNDLERLRDIQVHWVWDEATDKDLISHIVENKKFFFSNSMANHMLKLKPNFLHQDKDGKNFLMYAATNSSHFFRLVTYEVLNEDKFEKIDLKDSKYLLDKEGKGFYFYLFNGFDFEQFQQECEALKKNVQIKDYEISFQIYNGLQGFNKLLNHINKNSIALITNNEDENKNLIINKCDKALEMMNIFSEDLKSIEKFYPQMAVLGDNKDDISYDLNLIGKIRNYYMLDTSLSELGSTKKRAKL